MVENKKPILFLLLCVLIIASVSLWAGIKKAKKKASSKLNSKTPVFNYTGGRPDFVYNNPDSLIVQNKNPTNGPPYLSEELRQVPELHWQIRFFQPILKSIVEKEDALFLETEFEDINKNPKRVLVFIGGKLNKKDYPYTYIRQNDQQLVQIKDKSDIEQAFTLNKRISIEYLQTADNYKEGMKSEICSVNDDPVCKMAEFVNQYQNDYIKFYQTGELPENLFLMPLSINRSLNEK